MSTEVNGYKTAVHAFREKYMAAPGDMPNAIRFWGKVAGVDDDGRDPDCETGAAGTGTQTCNGDGSGRIDYETEQFRLWQQLSNAGMVEGNFAGIADPDGMESGGYNLPKSRFPNSAWRLRYVPVDFVGAERLGNALCIGINYGMIACDTPTLKPEDAYNIDAKMDDGKPITGMVGLPTSINGTHPNCVDGAGDYVLSDGTNSCYLLFGKIF